MTNLGAEFLINTTTVGEQVDPAITALADGRVMVTWGSFEADGSWDIRGRIVAPDGSATLNDFVINTTVASDQFGPAITALPDGRVMVTWFSTEGGSYDIRGRIIAPDGSLASADFIINTTMALDQVAPAITALPDGRVMVTWRSYEGENHFDIRGRVVAPDGSITPNDFVINTTTAGAQFAPTIAALADGRVVVTWWSLEGDSIRGRIVAPDGSATPDDFIINTTTTGEQYEPAITALADGRVMVTWYSIEPGSSEIRGRIVAPDGSVTPDDFVINTTTAGYQSLPAITALPDGRVMVTWLSREDGSGADIRGRIVAPDGSVTPDDFVINITSASDQYGPAITALPDGRVMVTWSSQEGGSGSYDIRGLVFDPDGPGIVVDGTANADFITGTPFADNLAGGGGNDRIAPGAGDDTVDGGSGTDSLVLSGNVLAHTIEYGSATGTYTVSGSNPETGTKTATGIERFQFDDWQGTFAEYSALPVPAGTDFLINTTTANEQSLPAITALPDGRVMVTWRSDEGGTGMDIRGRIIAPDGSATPNDFVINTKTANQQEQPAITALPDGRVMVTWYSFDAGGGSNIRGRIVAPDGSVTPDDFVINTTMTGGYLVSPAIAALADGRVMVTWLSTESDGNHDIRGRIIAPDGSVTPGDFVINTTTTYDQEQPAITALPDGRVMVTWQSYDYDSDGSWNIRGRIVAPDGSISPDDFVINTTVTSDEFAPAITALLDGYVMVTWYIYESDSGSTEIRGRIIAPDGSLTSDDFIINTTTASGQFEPAITALLDGRAMVTWSSQENGSYDIRGRIVAPDGSVSPADFIINTTTTTEQIAPAITTLPDGRVMVTWFSFESGSDSYDIRGRILDFAANDAPSDIDLSNDTVAENSASGTVIGMLSASDPDAGDTFTFTLLDDAGGHFAINGTDLIVNDSLDYETATSYEINVQVEDAEGATYTELFTINVSDVGGVLITGTANADTINAGSSAPGQPLPTNEDDTINAGDGGDDVSALDGNDTVKGQKGNDTVDGGLGDDTINGNNGIDLLLGGEGNDTIGGDNGNDTIYGDNGADTLNGGEGNDTVDGGNGTDTLDGGKGNDLLTGGDNDDTLNGNNGADTLQGGAGNDTLNGDNGNDTVDGGNGADTLNGGDGNDLVTGGDDNDTLNGNQGTDVLNGGAGNDTLNGNLGNDTIIGGTGSDTLVGGLDADTLTGGTGEADRFVFTAIEHSTSAQRDTITDFEHNLDIIDVSGIDANTVAGGDQAFLSVTQNASVVAHSITWREVAGNTIVRADVNGNTTADFVLVLSGTGLNLAQSDFML